MTISSKDVRRIAAEASVDPRTVARMYQGKKTRHLARERVVEAVKKLKLPAPPETT